MIRKMIPVRIKSRIVYHLRNADGPYDRYRGRPKAVIALAADYANLGDVAITFAQSAFLKECLPDHEIVFFPCADTFLHMKSLKRACTPDDIITITGGGNMGDLYDSLEDGRRFIVEQFPRNRILSFPQTISFSDTAKGKKELLKSRNSYRRHTNLHIFARESKSFETMRSAFPDNSVYLTPDIALSLKVERSPYKRRGVTVCMRNDRESSFSAGSRKAFIDQLSLRIPDVLVTDTIHSDPGRLPIPERFSQFHNLLDVFRRAETVVTDRLHGMIFAALTGTPCVVLQNNNHKIKATYAEWLSNLPHIRLQDNYDAAATLQMISELQLLDTLHITLPDLKNSYHPLRNSITG